MFINTAATALVSVGVGNGTRATRTSVVQDAGEFTFNPSATVDGGALTQLNFEPTVTVGGATLCVVHYPCHRDIALTGIRVSPTAYNVFTGMCEQEAAAIERRKSDPTIAYSVTSAYLSNGLCITTSGKPIPLDNAYTEVLESANGRVTLDANGLQGFIDYLSFSKCSGGGENIVPTALIQVTNTTATQTRTFSNVPLAAAVASLTIAPVSIGNLGISPYLCLCEFTHVVPDKFCY